MSNHLARCRPWVLRALSASLLTGCGSEDPVVEDPADAAVMDVFASPDVASAPDVEPPRDEAPSAAQDVTAIDRSVPDVSTPTDRATTDVTPPRDVVPTDDGPRADVSTPRDTGTPPPTSNAETYCPGGNCVRWWNCRVTYQYQYTSSRDWDTDYHMVDGTPIILAHRSRLTAVYVAGSGFQPEFTDLVDGEWIHYNHLHINSEFGGNDRGLGPVQLVSMTDPAHTDHIYPAGWVVGFSGGGTTRTGYSGTTASGAVCAGGHSTAAHFCAVTHSPHAINHYLPAGAGGCPSAGWPSALWTMIRARAPGYANCPSACNRCGVSHF